MTKEVLPGLGSGALREALTDLLSMHGTEHPKGLVYCRACTNARRLLSLSSPIELPPEVGAWNEGYDAGFGAATLKHTNPEEFARRAEHTKEVVMRVVAKWEGIEAKPTSQASSEIRELTGDILRTAMTPIFNKHASAWEPFPWEECAIAVRSALAPSRQGAAKRVEG